MLSGAYAGVTFPALAFAYVFPVEAHLEVLLPCASCAAELSYLQFSDLFT